MRLLHGQIGPLLLMVIQLVAQGHALLPEHPAALLVDVQAGLDGICGGLLLEDAAHAGIERNAAKPAQASAGY